MRQPLVHEGVMHRPHTATPPYSNLQTLNTAGADGYADADASPTPARKPRSRWALIDQDDGFVYNIAGCVFAIGHSLITAPLWHCQRAGRSAEAMVCSSGSVVAAAGLPVAALLLWWCWLRVSGGRQPLTRFFGPSWSSFLDEGGLGLLVVA